MQLKHPIRRTELSEKVLRARLSLRESQTQFAQRFRVTKLTVHNWESGKVLYMQQIYKEILAALIGRLQNEGRYVPVEMYEMFLADKSEWQNELASGS